MGSEVDPAAAGDDQVPTTVGHSRVASAPPPAAPLNPLRPAQSLPAELPSSNSQALVVRTPRPNPSWVGKGFLKKFTWRRNARRPSIEDPNGGGPTRADPADAEETFRCTFPWVDPTKVYGFGEELLALVSFVRRERVDDGGFRAVAVVGAGGIGKTTLCQLLFNEEKIKEDFGPRIWVSNSRQPAEVDDLKEAIVRRMLTQLGEDEPNDVGLSRLMSSLHRNLWGKKYLVVLDDALDADPWYYNLGAMPNMGDDWKNCLAYGLPKGSGGRVVVTSRNEEVARKMVGEHNLHKVLQLSDQEYCWSLFKESVGPCLDEEADKNGMNLEAMKGEVHAKSNGMPLAIKIMGQIMKEQIIEASNDRIRRTATD